jgi:hypothetical protein
MTLLTPRAARRDSSVPLLRTLIPKVVVQDRQCSVHAAAVSPRGCPRLCVVKVKLTMSLALSREPVELRRQAAPDFVQVSGGLVTQAASNRVVVVRGGVGTVSRPCAKRSALPGRAFSGPSLCVFGRTKANGRGANTRNRHLRPCTLGSKPPIWNGNRVRPL